MSKRQNQLRNAITSLDMHNISGVAGIASNMEDTRHNLFNRRESLPNPVHKKMDDEETPAKI
jgi:hypothetical protein